MRHIYHIHVRSFPKDEHTRTLWLKVCKLTSCSNMRVCDRHFNKDDWNNDLRTRKRLRLKKNAVPKIDPSKNDMDADDHDLAIMNASENLSMYI